MSPARLIGILIAVGSLLPCVAESRPAQVQLSAEERVLWRDQMVSTPSRHLDPLSEARREGRQTTLNLVVILVDFPDVPADRETHTPEYYEDLLFSRGTHPTGSVADFLYASSGGRLVFTGEVRGWFTASRDRNVYTAGRGGIGSHLTGNSQWLAREAVTLADPTINFAHFDNEGLDGVTDSGDDDQFVDGVVIIHAGVGREGGTTPDDFISVKWHTVSTVPLDGVFAYDFTLNPEGASVGLLVHELGHLMGLPDLYDTDGGSFGTGVWSMMSGGAWLADGVYPSDFDAWSKVQLGFADVRNLFLNADQERIVPTADGGMVYKLWAGGSGSKEYFLLENRQPRGLDRSLPGGGLLIYHIDGAVTSNNDARRYMVGVEQADGLFELENRFGDGNVGDMGDPFAVGDRFGRTTSPDSRSNQGEDRFVSVYDIQGPAADGSMTANLHVEPNPLVELVDLRLLELEGDGDGLVESGEVAGVLPTVSVTRLPAFDFVIRTSSLDPLGEVLDPEVTLGTIIAGHQMEPEEPIRVRIRDGVPTDPYGLRLQFDLAWRDDMGRRVDVELGVGNLIGREDDFNKLDHGWVHAPMRSSTKDQWAYAPSLGADGTPGFKCGFLAGGFINGIDAYLESPPILLPPSAELVFDHLVDINTGDDNVVRAGGFIEISLNGGDWQSAEPDGEYPNRFFGLNPEWNGRAMYSGQINEGEFFSSRVDLSEYSGSLRIRFRFFSAVRSNRGQGWHIDNVVVRAALTPVRLLARDARIVDEDVVLTWELAEPLPDRVRWLRGSDPLTAAIVGGGWLAAARDGFLRDPGGARLLPDTYWMEGLERDGTVLRLGPWTVDAVPVAAALRVLNNPSAAVTQLRWSGLASKGLRLEILDVRGRRVRSQDLIGASGDLFWDGVDDQGRRVAPGIYFARLRGSAAPTVRIVRLP